KMTKNFLAKKSWHTGSIKHMEKVWKAEQVAGEEQAKIDALKKELAEEQRLYELKRMADEANGRKVDRIEWMYTIKKGPTTDEYLMGQAVKTDDSDKQEMEALTKQPGSLFVRGQVSVSMDQAAKVKEDPMLAIELQRQNARKEFLSNPVQMKKVKENSEVRSLLKKMKKMKKQEKKEKKERKRAEKEERGEKRKRSESPERKEREADHLPEEKTEKRERDRDPLPEEKTERREREADHLPEEKTEKKEREADHLLEEKGEGREGREQEQGSQNRGQERQERR
ncbi:hypothetical protein PROFUN_10946, partial [Planoprotostelium fungivorum]